MDTASTDDFGARLRRLREGAALSQEELAERAGLTAAAVSALERGARKRPFPHTLQSLADALRLTDEERRALFASVPARTGTAVRAREQHNEAQERPAPPPAPLTSLVGRARELATVESVLLRPGVRILTITGPAGVGKTRLALEAAHALGPRYESGAAWIEMADVAEAAAVLPSIARSLDLLQGRAGEAGQLLLAHLRRRRMLLVLDNFEQVVAGSLALARLLQACPEVDLLITSREALRIRGEHEIRLGPLGLPHAGTGDARTIAAASAVMLLVERARAVSPGFALTDANALAVSTLCQRLDGLPLAVELAAAQLKYMSPGSLLEWISRDDASLGGASRDLPARQQSLEAALRWGYDLLTAQEQALFRRLAVFAGGFSIAAAVDVCADDAVSDEQVRAALFALSDKSMLQVEADGDGRFGMLGTIRRYALARLEESHEAPVFQARHARYFAALAAEAEPRLHGVDRAIWLRRLDTEASNLRAAVAWSIGDDGDPRTGMKLTGALGWYWVLRGELATARQATAALLSGNPEQSPEDAAPVLYTAAAVAWKYGDLEAARDFAGRSIGLFRSLNEPRRLAFALAVRGLVAVSLQSIEDAVSYHTESLALFQRSGYRWGAAYAHSNLGDVLFERGEVEAARQHYDEALAEFTRENDPWGTAIVLHTLGNVALRQGDLSRAGDCYGRSVELSRRIGNGIEAARSLIGRAAVALGTGDAAAAERSLNESLGTWRDLENADGVAICLTGLAAVAFARGRHRKVSTLLSEAAAACAEPSLYVVDRAIFDPYLPGASTIR